jgi:SAM-dependent methyltransferase
MSEIERDTGEYVLGTHAAEVERLGLQHRLWRPRMLDAWRRAGIGPGQSVVDVGAGPGHATLDLAELVGPAGSVLAVERSARFLETLHARAAQRGLANVRTLEADVVLQDFGVAGLDAAWCRWVLCFVTDPARVLQHIYASLRPGGIAVFHEYVAYGTWRVLPPCPEHAHFVQQVMRSWRDEGGNPDVALELPAQLAAAGFTLVHAAPVMELISPADPMWDWPRAYQRTGPPRLVELGYMTSEEAVALDEAMRAVEQQPHARMLLPAVLEVIARREA